jgi:hypothetical protein
MSKRILIVGGVPGGTNASVHARRVSEDAEIFMFRWLNLFHQSSKFKFDI